ncbi:uncharacterized protein LOC116418120 [Nasonia vitripennis]|uniref:Transposase n=2 Tax=Nasonia vitripennis TaxID=7425 RepID=A0A7M7QI04_NASVI|nr:uncharacterized protein LOC116417349 [Nasonia vitripennis]XP_031789121.2 uncharacterized protein LOC116418120 [Nasonia vitripennis]
MRLLFTLSAPSKRVLVSNQYCLDLFLYLIQFLYLDVSKESVRRIVRVTRRPYKPTKVQKVFQRDHERRQAYCEWGLRQLARNPLFFRRVCFSDESTFTNNGPINKQVTRMWSEQNPHWFIENDRQHRWKFNVWIGIVGDRIIGPIFYNENLTARRYRRLLRLINGRLHDNPIPQNQMWWQMDGAPAHNAAVVTEYLEERFPERWIGLNSPHVRFPPRSPDLTIMDYYFFGNIKRICYTQVKKLKNSLYSHNYWL